MSKVQRMFVRSLEHKVNLLSQASTTITNTGALSSLTSVIAQGDDINQRSGDQITIRKFTINFRFGAVTTNQTCRFIVVRDMMNQGAAPAVTDVLAAALYRSEYNPTLVVQQKRFLVVHDEFIDSNLNGETLQTRVVVRNSPNKVFYNGAAAAGTSNGKGSYWILVIGDAITGLYEYTSQIWYTDA
jgi:hypothetical protein